MHDDINHPDHYTRHPSGIECIDVTENFMGNLSNAIKYIWRCDLKGEPIKDLKKAEFYIRREIKRRKKEIKRREKEIERKENAEKGQGS